ncbi:acyl-coenzyme A thioesterase 8-like isoform X1 [Oscarella lobularis]|uniref:acyl-coenzyme A thioesterase 8-like isoform X1 n=1 Tax=Oscarella lobularis TaxID=121494 RepID=UPI003314117C
MAEAERSFVKTVFRLEEIDKDLFRGDHMRSVSMTRVFGGQIASQALVAAQCTVSNEQTVHSLHTYFLRPGDLSVPILYRVTHLRDGRSFASRSVEAIQRGRFIAHVVLSFQTPEISSSSIVHQVPMPRAPDPDTLEAMIDPFRVRGFGVSESNDSLPSFEFRDATNFAEWAATRRVWLKAVNASFDNSIFHSALLALISDSFFISAALRTHSSFQFGMATSLDHSIYFHSTSVRADDWILFDVESSRASNNRALGTGRLYARDGTLIMTAVQEALIRPKL